MAKVMGSAPQQDKKKTLFNSKSALEELAIFAVLAAILAKYKKYLSFSNFKQQLFSSSLPFVLFSYSRAARVISQISQSLQLQSWHWKTGEDIFRLLFILFRGVLVSCFLNIRLHKIVTLLFEILWSFGVLILAKCCGSFNKCNTYFLRRLDLSLFFRK